MKKLTAIILAVCLALSAGCAAAEPAATAPVESGTYPKNSIEPTSREEVIYGVLGADGAVSSLYAVTALELDSAGTVKSLGGYDSVDSLTAGSEAAPEDGGASLSAAGAGRYYFRGRLTDTELPWRVSVGYELDGKAVEPESLAGAEGKLKIAIKTKAGTTGGEYYDNYLMQITVTLDASGCRDIEAPGATIASAGANKTIAFSVMPGSNGSFTVSAQVKDLELDGIQFAAVPMNMGAISVDTGGISGKLGELADAVKQLSEGASELSDGASSLEGGLYSLKNGMWGFYSGLSELDGGTPGLKEGSAKVREALKAISSSLAGVDFSSLDQIVLLGEPLNQLATGLNGLSGELAELASRFGASYGALAAAIGALPEPVDVSALEGSADADVQALVSAYRAQSAAIASLKAVFSTEKLTFDLLAATLPSLAEDVGGSAYLAGAIAEKLPASVPGEAAAGFSQLAGNLSQLAASYAEFDSGLTRYADGVTALSSQCYSLYGGVSSSASGASGLASGVGEYASGVKELEDGVSNMEGEVQDAVDDMLGEYDRSDFVPTSFTDAGNGKCGAVQFVFTTEPIKTAEQEPSSSPEQDSGFWDRLTAMFK